MAFFFVVVVADLHFNTETHLEVFPFMKGNTQSLQDITLGKLHSGEKKTYNLHSLIFISYSFREDTGLLLDLVESSNVDALHLQENKNSS